MEDPTSPFRIREPRSPLAFPVLVEWYDDVRRHIARNISDSGIFIDADPPYPIGSIVRIVFIYPGTQVELVAVGQVCHHASRPRHSVGTTVESTGVGISFLKFEDGVVKPVASRMAS